MPQSIFLRLALPTPLRRLFDYLPPQDIDPKILIPGVRVQVPFQSRTLTGVLLEINNQCSIPYEKLKRAQAILDTEPLLSNDVYKLCHWAADYYHYALGEVLHTAMPGLIRKGKVVAPSDRSSISAIGGSCESLLTLDEHQATAVKAIINAQNLFKTFLLEGVTGSGKTEVYLQAMTAYLKQGQQVLVLVPEINLTPQTIARFQSRFSVPVVALHSSLTEKARYKAWAAARDGSAKIIIGTRSAIFTSLQNLGLIIVDEEHDTSFKQQDRFRYHARDLAIMRASICKIPVVLGSATPSFESLLNVKRDRYQLLSLPNRAGVALLPSIEVVDLRKQTLDEGLSQVMLQHITQHLSSNQQVMLFLNKRGFAPALFCKDCSFIAECKRCEMRMVYHRQPPHLQCHSCDTQKKLPKICEKCESSNLIPIGLGTQRLEETLTKHFPDVPMIRLDRDSTRRKDNIHLLLDQIHQSPKAILIGTQMLAKGHHFPNVTLVGIVDADSGFFSTDFRAAEQMGQLIIQVAGRAGRGEKNGTVLIQTRHPENALLQTLIHEGYPTFANKLLAEREQSLLPPYSYFAVFKAEAYQEKNATDFLTAIKTLCPDSSLVNLLGPMPALLAKRKGLHCKHLIIKATQRATLQEFLKKGLQQIESLAKEYAVKWALDVDPIEV